MNLGDLMKKTNYKGLELQNVVKFSRQIAHAIKYIHRNNFIHCDLKLQNIVMVNSKKCKIKILDFGISRVDEKINDYFYVQTLYYRAPEIFEKKNYNKLIDIWSYGCLIGELYTGFPLIYGKDEKHQYKLIKNVKSIISNLKIKNDDNLDYLKDILKKSLIIDPNYRPDINQLLIHKFLNK